MESEEILRSAVVARTHSEYIHISVSLSLHLSLCISSSPSLSLHLSLPPPSPLPPLSPYRRRQVRGECRDFTSSSSRTDALRIYTHISLSLPPSLSLYLFLSISFSPSLSPPSLSPPSFPTEEGKYVESAEILRAVVVVRTHSEYIHISVSLSLHLSLCISFSPSLSLHLSLPPPSPLPPSLPTEEGKYVESAEILRAVVVARSHSEYKNHTTAYIST